MSKAQLENALKTAFPSDIVDEILSSYQEIESNFRLEKWKASELDAGHFVESVRRLVEYKLTGTYTPFGAPLPNFNQQVLNGYENGSADEEYRIIIPRILYSVYCIRNKRGVGHVGKVKPNKLDANYIYGSVKWVLAELVRIAANISISEAEDITNEVLEKKLDIIWKSDGIYKILNPKLKTKDKVLLVLYNEDSLAFDEIKKRVNYSNGTQFRKILRDLDKVGLVGISDTGHYKISPVGICHAEKIIGAVGISK